MAILSERTVHIDTKGALQKVSLIILILGACALGWFSISWQLGNMLGETVSPTDPEAPVLARSAKSLSPYDPVAAWLLASVEFNPSDSNSLKRFVSALESVVRLSPYDNRWWIELARAYEQSGDLPRAEAAFRRAVELAPGYAYPRWQFGNFYLRTGRGDEAFVELKRSAESSSVYRAQVFSVAWDYYDRDGSKLSALADGNPEMLAGLTKFYASKERAEEALSVWNSMSDADRQKRRDIGSLVARALFEKRFFRSAAEFVRTLGTDSDVAVGSISNGGFETQLSEKSDDLFGWFQYKKDKIEIRQDQIVKRSGQRSLRIGFKGFNGSEIGNLYQFFAVDSGAALKLRFFVKTEDLKTPSPIILEIAGVNSADLRKTEIVPGTLAKGDVPGGTNDWSEVVSEFTVPDGVEGLQVRVNRAACGEACSVYGTIWLDDIKLERVR